MRYYLIGDNSEWVFDLVKTTKVDRNLYQFRWTFPADPGKEERGKKEILIKKLAGHYFCSHDGKSWKKVPRQELPPQILYHGESYKLCREFKPSSMMGSEEGALYTKMPGKVVKILGEVGHDVLKGQTLLIIEAMKMENEIKSNQDGTIKYIHVQEGQALEQGVLLMELEGK